MRNIQSSYTYYPNGLRRSKKVNDGPEIVYYYDTSGLPNILNEVSQENYSSYLAIADQRFIRIVHDSSSTNCQYNINSYRDAILDISEDKNTLKAKMFDPYGKPKKLDKEKVLTSYIPELSDNPFGYSNEYLDVETGLIYLRSRYYNPSIKRFITRDTAFTFNRYSYCDTNPVMLTDPSGHFAGSFASASTAASISSEIMATGTVAAPVTGGTSLIVVGVVVAALTCLAIAYAFTNRSNNGACDNSNYIPQNDSSSASVIHTDESQAQRIREIAALVQVQGEYSKNIIDIDLSAPELAVAVGYPESINNLAPRIIQLVDGDDNQERQQAAPNQSFITRGLNFAVRNLNRLQATYGFVSLVSTSVNNNYTDEPVLNQTFHQVLETINFALAVLTFGAVLFYRGLTGFDGYCNSIVEFMFGLIVAILLIGQVRVAYNSTSHFIDIAVVILSTSFIAGFAVLIRLCRQHRRRRRAARLNQIQPA